MRSGSPDENGIREKKYGPIHVLKVRPVMNSCETHTQTYICRPTHTFTNTTCMNDTYYNVLYHYINLLFIIGHVLCILALSFNQFLACPRVYTDSMHAAQVYS